MAPSPTTISGNKRKTRNPDKSAVSSNVEQDKKTLLPPEQDKKTSSPPEVVEVPEQVSATTAKDSEDRSAVGSSSTSSQSVEKTDKYAELRKQLQKHKSPRAAKKQQQLKKKLPPCGDGKNNKIYTNCTADGSEVAFAMHKKKSDTFAFTKNIDDAMKTNPTIKERAMNCIPLSTRPRTQRKTGSSMQ